MKKFLSLGPALLVFVALLVFSRQAAEGARQGLWLCLGTLGPSLFPFFVLSRLLTSLGLTDLLGRRLGPAMQKLFGVSAAGAEAFSLGISGGYPLGAAAVAELKRSGRISTEEAQRLLGFCSNSGPAFILGSAGAILGSARAGLALYGAHVLAAVTAGLLLRPGQPETSPPAQSIPPRSFAEAFPDAVSGAVKATVAVCSYVCFFSALLAMAKGFSFLPGLAAAGLSGFFELGSGIAALRGCGPTPPVMALAGFLTGWGGLSVHCQTLALLSGTGIKSTRHLAGRALSGVFTAVYSFLLAYLI